MPTHPGPGLSAGEDNPHLSVLFGHKNGPVRELQFPDKDSNLDYYVQSVASYR